MTAEGCCCRLAGCCCCRLAARCYCCYLPGLLPCRALPLLQEPSSEACCLTRRGAPPRRPRHNGSSSHHAPGLAHRCLCTPAAEHGRHTGMRDRGKLPFVLHLHRLCTASSAAGWPPRAINRRPPGVRATNTTHCPQLGPTWRRSRLGCSAPSCASATPLPALEMSATVVNSKMVTAAAASRAREEPQGCREGGGRETGVQDKQHREPGHPWRRACATRFLAG